MNVLNAAEPYTMLKTGNVVIHILPQLIKILSVLALERKSEDFKKGNALLHITILVSGSCGIGSASDRQREGKRERNKARKS